MKLHKLGVAMAIVSGLLGSTATFAGPAKIDFQRLISRSCLHALP